MNPNFYNASGEDVPQDKKIVMNITEKEVYEICSPQRAIYSVFHTIMFFIAIFLSFRCNRGFNVGSFLVACLCPPLYILYILVTEYDKDLCGLIPPMVPSK